MVCFLRAGHNCLHYIGNEQLGQSDTLPARVAQIILGRHVLASISLFKLHQGWLRLGGGGGCKIFRAP